MILRCGCGGRLYSLDDLMSLCDEDGDPEGMGYREMYESLVGPMDLWCWEEDELLTEHEIWRARGLWTPGHDQAHPDTFQPTPHDR